MAIGQERTRAELLPYLTELLDDDDLVLIALAQSLSQFLPLCGGKLHAHLLFDPLEQLCQVEESSVREAATLALKDLFCNHPDIIETKGFELISRFSKDELYTSKQTSASLIPVALPHCSEQK